MTLENPGPMVTVSTGLRLQMSNILPPGWATQIRLRVTEFRFSRNYNKLIRSQERTELESECPGYLTTHPIPITLTLIFIMQKTQVVFLRL